METGSYKMNIGLLTTIHDPKCKNLNLLRKNADYLKQLYKDIFITVSDQTNFAYIEELKKYHFNVEVIPKKGAANARREVLKFGINSSVCDYFHYCDFDRLLTWIKNNFEELNTLIKDTIQCDYLIIGRTEEAFLTHPIEWIETEKLSNRVFSLVFGQEVDITAGSCAFSRRSAKLIAEHSSDEVTDSEWPMIIHRLTSYKMSYIAVKGLEYFEDINGVNVVKNEADDWLSRIRLCYLISNSAVNKFKKEHISLEKR